MPKSLKTHFKSKLSNYNLIQGILGFFFFFFTEKDCFFFTSFLGNLVKYREAKRKKIIIIPWE